MTPTTASTIRAIIRLAIDARRRRDARPPMSLEYWCANDAMRAFLLAAKIVAIHAK